VFAHGEHIRHIWLRKHVFEEISLEVLT